MKRTFEVQNVKCGNCAQTLRKALEEFGEVEVNLLVHPRQITLDIEEEQIPKLREILKSIGYPMTDEELGAIENVTTKAKSLVSCALGKFGSKEES